MKKVKTTIKITKNGDHGYICTCDYPFEHFDLGGSGDTVEAAKNDCFAFYDEMKEEHPNESFPELDIEWEYDFPSFFNKFDYLNISKVAKYIGMNPSNFRHYAAGSKSMSQKQFLKVKEAFSKMADELKESVLTM